MPKLEFLLAAMSKQAGLDPLHVAPFVVPTAAALEAGTSAPDGEGARAALLTGGGSMLGSGAGGIGGASLGKLLAQKFWIPGADPKAAPLLSALGTLFGGLAGSTGGGLLGAAAGKKFTKATSENPYYRYS